MTPTGPDACGSMRGDAELAQRARRIWPPAAGWRRRMPTRRADARAGDAIAGRDAGPESARRDPIVARPGFALRRGRGRRGPAHRSVLRRRPARSCIVATRPRERAGRTIWCAPARRARFDFARGRDAALRAPDPRRFVAGRAALGRREQHRAQRRTAPTPSSSSPCSAWRWWCWSVRSAWRRRCRGARATDRDPPRARRAQAGYPRLLHAREPVRDRARRADRASALCAVLDHALAPVGGRCDRLARLSTAGRAACSCSPGRSRS